MNRTRLTMLPSQRYDNPSEMPVMERDGFVDDAVVLALLAGPIQTRKLADSGDLVLSADDMDFAGWCLPAAPAAAPRRPAPPVLEEPGLGEPYKGHHRWWLASLAGALSSLVFSLLLFSLASRQVSPADHPQFSSTPAAPRPTTTPKMEKPQAGPELTEASPLK